MIHIYLNKNGDTRVAENVPTITQFDSANREHTEHVKYMLEKIRNLIYDAAIKHDHTKLEEPKRSWFYRDVVSQIENGGNFVEKEWYKNHIREERHHLNKCVPDGVNLVDVLECLADCVCASWQRAGKPFDPSKIDEIVSQETLSKAVVNTIELMNANVDFHEE